MCKSSRDLSRTQADRLAHLLETSGKGGPGWRAEDLAAIFRHQLSVPIADDLRDLSPDRTQELCSLASSQGVLLRSFADLFLHPHPPVELLALTKAFAKDHRKRPDSPLPPEIATMLYYASIAVAISRCGQRLTRLSDADLREGLTWARDQSWIDQRMRAVFEDALGNMPPAPPG
jgi:hypothetical protein